MTKVLLLLALLLGLTTSFAHELEPDSQCDEKLDYQYYSVCYSQAHRQALWTFHALTKSSINGSSKRENNYRLDPQVSDPVTKNDYKGSGYDRGHLVPAGDMKLNKTSMSETFYMTNMSPQKPDLNRKIWNALEGGLRKMVENLGDAYVVTAPILTNNLNQLPSNVSIPKFYYKIIYFPKQQLMRAYLLENKSYSHQDYSQHQISVDQIEQMTGIDFFSHLEDSLEEKLEREIR